MTPLMIAAMCGHPSVVQRLLACKEIQVNLKDPDGYTALLYACKLGHAGVAVVLLSHGADPCLPKADGEQPLMAAAYGGYRPIVQRLLACDRVDVNARDNQGWTAMYYASCKGHVEVVDVLLTHGADPCLVTTDGHTPLMAAAMGDHRAIVERLLACDRVDVNVQDNKGETALYHGIVKGHAAVVDVLLAYGADPSNPEPLI